MDGRKPATNHHEHSSNSNDNADINESAVLTLKGGLNNRTFNYGSCINESTTVRLQESSNENTKKRPETNGTVNHEPNSKPQKLKPFQIFRYANGWDIILMIIGLLAAISSGALYPLIYYVFQSIINAFVAIGRNQTSLVATNNDTLGCRNVTSIFNNTHMSPYDQIISTIKWYGIFGGGCFVLLLIAFNCWIISAERQVRRMRYALMENIMRQDIGWFDCRLPSDLSAGLLVDALDNVREGIGYQIADCTALLARIVGCLTYSLYIGWKLTLVFLSVSPLIIITFNVTVIVMKKFTINEGKAYTKANAIVDEVFSAVRTVTAFGAQKHERERYERSLTDAKTAGLKKGLYLGICQVFVNITLYGAIALIFWYGPHLARVECQNYDAGTVIIIFTACLFSTNSISMFVPYLVSFIETSVSGAKVFAVIDQKSPIDHSNISGNIPLINGDITLRNVTFNYPSRKENRPILNGINLHFAARQTTAIVGETGCGKSTIIQLLQRFYDPERGDILLDDTNIRHINLSWLRSNISVVSQEPVLFTCTIAENIRFGNMLATDEQVQAAARIANIHDFIQNLPEGYGTLVKGSRLSGGQKQRIAIARAILSNPKILLLDEATSALDARSERDVQIALEQASKGRTTIVVAHRLSTIRNADRIIGLKAGQIEEEGTHEELVQRGGHYAQAVILQGMNDSHHEKEEEEEEEEEENAHGNRNDQLTSSVRSEVLLINNDDIDNSVDGSKPRTSGNICQTPFFLRVLALNSPEWISILLGSLASLIYGAVAPAYAFIFSRVFGLFSQDGQTAEENSRLYSIIVLCIGVVGGLCQFISTYAFARSGEALTVRMRVMSFGTMLRQEMSWYDEESNQHSILVTRLAKDAAALKGMTGVTIGAFLNAVGTVAAGLVISFFAGWKLTLALLGFTPLIVLTGFMLGQRVAKAGQKKDLSSHAERGSMYATESLKNMRTVTSLQLQDYFIKLYKDAYDKEFRKSLWKSQKIVAGNALANSIMFFLQMTAFGYGARLVLDGEMTYVQVFQVFSVIAYATVAFGRSASMVPNYSRAKEASLRIMDLNARQSLIDPDDEKQGRILGNVNGNFEFRNVSFKYPSRKGRHVLRDLSFKCGQGTATAIVGPSGSGKSTCIALLERFYDPQDGEVLLDGHDIRTLNVKWFRSIIGLVQQEPILFNLSIRENIAYGDTTRTFTDAEIFEAARQADIHHTITALAQGYETLCGASGQAQLAGGQKQRIAIARLLIRQPKIVLFDEATSALNVAVEKNIMRELDRARANRTCVTVAHRLSTIRNSEKIVVLVRGRLEEQGTDEELSANRRGTYSQLLKASGLETTMRKDADDTE